MFVCLYVCSQQAINCQKVTKQAKSLLQESEEINGRKWLQQRQSQQINEVYKLNLKWNKKYEMFVNKYMNNDKCLEFCEIIDL